MGKTKQKILEREDHRNIVTGSKTTFEILNNRDSDGDGIPDSIDPAPTIVDDKYRYAEIDAKNFEKLSDELKAKIDYRPKGDGYIIRANENVIKEIEVIVQPLVPHKSAF